MNTATDIIITLLVLTNLNLLGSSRLGVCVRVVAVQGALLGLVPLLTQLEQGPGQVWAVALVSIVLKAGVLPWLLNRALRATQASREVEPFVGFSMSLAIGVGLLGVSIFLGTQLTPPRPAASTFLVPVALFTVMVGLFIIVSRKKAITQALGYLAMENGIYAFGLAFAVQEPLVVELGILLDVFVAVFVMGITIYNINREFDHIDTDRLAELRD